MMCTQSRTPCLYLWGSIFLLGLLPLGLYWPAYQQPFPPGSSIVRDIAVFEQWLVVITAFGAKPAYMVLSLAWII